MHVEPHRDGSDEYPQSLVWSKNKKIGILKFLYIKVGFEGVYFTWTCYPDVNANIYNLLLKTGNIREVWGTSILPVSLDSICGVNGFQ